MAFPHGRAGTSIVLQPPAPPGCGATDGGRRTIAELMAKGSYACITLATKDLDGDDGDQEGRGLQRPTWVRNAASSTIGNGAATSDPGHAGR